MRLAVISHKPCWRSPSSPSGYATDGGFPMQMRAISGLFDETRLLVPVEGEGPIEGERPLTGHRLSVVEMCAPRGHGLVRRALLLPWAIANAPTILRQYGWADAIHAPVPGDIGALGILLAFALKKNLFIRHCGNWLAPRTKADRWLKSFMTRRAGGRNVMLATGGGDASPCGNPDVHWIFSTSLTHSEVKSLARHRSLPDAGSLRLCTAGRQEHRKGTGRIIQALPEIRRRLPHATLTVAGDGRDLPEFKRIARELGLESAVYFLGRLNHSQVLQAMQEADLFVFPTSASEGFPKVVHEALACGLPVVTTPVSVLPHIIGQGCGCLLSSHEPSEIARGVFDCSDPTTYATFSTRSLQVAQQYCLEAWQGRIGSLLTAAWGPLRAPSPIFQVPAE